MSRNREENFSSALVTGASRGIGREISLCLAGEPSIRKLILVCEKSRGSLTETAEDCLRLRNKSLPALTVETASGDISDYSFVQSLREQFGSVQILINNAAVSWVGLLTDMSPEQWQRSLQVNLTSLYNTCHIFVPDMIQAKAGRILNVSSVWGIAGASCEVAYSATKGGVNAFTKALAKELGPSHIACNAIAPGIVDTDMNGHLSPQEKDAVCEEIPAGRMASPREAAEAMMHILKMPSYFTGEILRFDGGWL